MKNPHATLIENIVHMICDTDNDAVREANLHRNERPTDRYLMLRGLVTDYRALLETALEAQRQHARFSPTFSRGIECHTDGCTEFAQWLPEDGLHFCDRCYCDYRHWAAIRNYAPTT